MVCAIAWVWGEGSQMTDRENEFETADLPSLAIPYALHALSDGEREVVEARLADVESEIANAFFDEVRAVRETMARVASVTATEPPTELRRRILAAVAGDNVRAIEPNMPSPQTAHRWRSAILAAAAVLAVGLGGLGIGVALRPAPEQPSKAQQVFAASDVRTTSGAIPVGGTATVVYSHHENAAVLVMNNVPPPKPGTVYQMWLVNPAGATSAGTMDAQAVAPSTTAVLPNLGDSTSLAFTVEPNSGSTKPTGQFIAELPIS